MSERDVVIVGGGLAAASCARKIREAGSNGAVTVIAAEDELPYERPPLSKEYLKGDVDRASMIVQDAGWYDDMDITLRRGSVVSSLDVAGHRVRLGGEEDLSYDSLVLATGSLPRRFDVPGGDARNVHVLRTISDSDTLRHVFERGDRRVVVLGTGWIGLETAAAARGFGNDVTIIGGGAVPLAGPLGTEMGSVFRDLHAENGVRWMLGRRADGFIVEGESVSAVTVGEAVVAADVVIVAQGARPAVDLAETAGLDTSDGVLVDEHLAASAPDVWAIGDIANAWHPGIQRRMRVEHWQNAIDSGQVAAINALGGDATLDRIPYFFTDQYDLGMEYSGYPPLAAGADVIVRGDLARREFLAFWLADDRVVAGMNVNIWDVNAEVQVLIRSGKRVERSRLRDGSISIADV